MYVMVQLQARFPETSRLGLKARASAACQRAHRRQPADGPARLPGLRHQLILMKMKHGILFSWLVQSLDEAINSSFQYGFMCE